MRSRSPTREGTQPPAVGMWSLSHWKLPKKSPGQRSLTPHSWHPPHPSGGPGFTDSLLFLSLSPLPPSLFTFRLSNPALPLRGHSVPNRCTDFLPLPLDCFGKSASSTQGSVVNESTFYLIKEVLEILPLLPACFKSTTRNSRSLNCLWLSNLPEHNQDIYPCWKNRQISSIYSVPVH